MTTAARAIGVAAAIVVAGCTTTEMSRNVYEGVKARDESSRSPTEGPRPQTPSYDQYERERRSRSRPEN